MNIYQWFHAETVALRLVGKSRADFGMSAMSVNRLGFDVEITPFTLFKSGPRKGFV